MIKAKGSERKELFISITIIFLSLSLSYLLVFRPRIRDISGAKQALQDIQTPLGKASQAIPGVEKYEKEGTLLELDMVSLKTKIPREQQIPQLLDKLRRIAREIGITSAAAHAALRALRREDVLELRNMGKTHIYSLKENSFLVSSLLKPLFAKEDKILDTIIDMIKRKILSSKAKKEIVSVALFGSVSIRRENPASDIDIAVIVENAKAKAAIERLFEEVDINVSKEFGNAISIYVNTRAEFKVKYKKGLAVIKNILKSNNLIYGERLESLLWQLKRKKL